MFEGRFAHGCIQKDNFIYCIGGNIEGKGSETTINFCERFNLASQQWEQIGNLNERRCAMVVEVFNKQVMVAGGFNGKNQLNTIELFNE